jgi:hypothetical protein
MCPNPFLSKLMHSFNNGKNWATSVIFKQLPKEKITQRAKIRPIWSPWLQIAFT